MTTTREYRSTDSGAPTVEGVVGSLSGALTAMLVGTSGVAYGSGGSVKTAAGWTVAFTGTNKVALRNSLAAGGTGCYMRIDDSGGGAGGAREALIQFFEAMSDVDTGTGPASSLNSGLGVWVRKSDVAASGARAWLVLADERSVYINLYANAATVPAAAGNSTDGYYYTLAGGGDIEPLIPGDPSICVFGRPAANDSSGSINSIAATSATYAGSTQGFALSRNNVLAASPVPASLPILGRASNNSGIGGPNVSVSMANPTPGATTTIAHAAWIAAENGIRGRMRGLYVPLNYLAGSKIMGDTVTPLGTPAGSSMVVMGAASVVGNNANAPSRLLVERNLSWDS